MSENTDSLSSVVVLEEGAEWPKWIAEYQRRAPNSIVVAHTDGETLDHMRERVVRRVSEVTGELRVGIVACSPNVDAAHLGAREQICRVILDAMRPSRGGEVVLAASVDASDAARHHIFELAGALCEGLSGAHRSVRVRFSSGRPESGIMPSLASAQPALDRDVAPPLAASRG